MKFVFINDLYYNKLREIKDDVFFDMYEISILFILDRKLLSVVLDSEKNDIFN